MQQAMTRFLGWLGFLLLLTGPATPAQQARSLTINGPANAAAGVGRSEMNQIEPAQRNPRYKIGRDDVLLISFPLSPELNQKVTVQPDGFISLQGAGEIQVMGLTVPGAVETVKKAYANTLHDPIVDIDLTDFQKPFFTVFGQVGKPGQYDLRYDITVTQAIAVAGGFTATGKTQVLLYHPTSSNWAQVRELKLKGFLHGKNVSEDVHLQPGDMIFVPEKAIAKFREYVPYTFSVVPPYPTTF